MKNTDIELKYITTSKQALQYLAKKLKGKDLDALKVLARDIDMMHHKDKKHHWLFAKLYAAVICLVIEKKGNLFIAIDKVNTYLRKQWKNHLIDLQGLIDDSKDCKVWDSADEIMDHLNHSKIEPDKIPSLEKKIKPHEIEMNDLEETITESINTALNDEKNYG